MPATADPQNENGPRDPLYKMLKNLLRLYYPQVDAEKGTLVLASLKLLLNILLASYGLSRIILLTLDNTLYGIKDQLVAFFWCVSLLALGMILDASWILWKKQQSSAVKKRGVFGSFLQLFVLIISPIRILGLVPAAAVAGMLGITVSLLAAIL